MSRLRSKNVIDTNINIQTPTLVKPLIGSIQFDSFFQADPYKVLNGFRLVHDKSHWQVALDPEFKQIIDECKGSRQLKSWSPDIDYSKYSKTKIYVRVKYGANLEWSDWSKPHNVTTK